MDQNKKTEDIVKNIIKSGAPKKKLGRPSFAKEKLTQKTFNITEAQAAALKIESSIKGKDMSQILREALDEYLGDSIEQAKKLMGKL